MIKLKRTGGHINLEIGDNIAHLTYQDAVTLGNHLIQIAKPYAVEITLEPTEFRDVSEDGTVSEQFTHSIELSNVPRAEYPKSE